MRECQVWGRTKAIVDHVCVDEHDHVNDYVNEHDHVDDHDHVNDYDYVDEHVNEHEHDHVDDHDYVNDYDHVNDHDYVDESVNRIVVPRFSSLSALICPPCASMIERAMASPNPAPPEARWRAGSAR